MLESERKILEDSLEVGVPVPNYDAMIERIMRRNGLGYIFDDESPTVTRAHPDPFGIRDEKGVEDDPDVIDVDFEAIKEAETLNFAERIKLVQKKSGILELIKDEISTVLCASDDPFDIRGDDDPKIIDVEFEVMR